jgi:hypothetical protein
MAARSALLIAAILSITSTVIMGIGRTLARDSGDNVVVIDVAKVSVPKGLPGQCRVSGLVEQVRNGSAFHNGQSLTVAVPCGSQVHREDGPAISDSSPIFQDVEVLKGSKTGFVHLNDAGELIWQPSQQSYGTMGHAVGYRVLDGVKLQISPATPT